MGLGRAPFLYSRIVKIKKSKVMYSLKCSYYTAKFSTINELISNIIESGMDPNYEITKDGVSIGEEAINYIQF
jgi:hypothetical protein